MFNKNLNNSLQRLHNCVTQVEILHSKHEHHHNFNLHLNHILNGLKSVQTSLRETISQYLHLVSKIQNKMSNTNKKEGERLVQNRGSNEELNLQELERWVEQVVIRRKMDHASLCSKESELLLQEVILSKFPVLLAQINKRRQQMRQIQQINHNLQTLQRNLQLQTNKQQTTLNSVLKRLQKINLSIKQAEDQSNDKKKTIGLADFIKYHNQTQSVLNLIVYGNLCSLQQSSAQIENCQLKTSVCKVIEQMKRYDQHVHTIYQFLYEIVLNSFSQMSKKSQMAYKFLKSIESVNLAQKLKQCTKLVNQYKRNTVSVIPESMRIHLDETKFRLPTKPQKQIIEVKLQQIELDKRYFQQQMLLLQHQEFIHELQQQLIVRKQQIQILQNNRQQKIDQMQKLKQQNSILQEQSQHLQKQIEKLSEKQSQFKYQCEKAQLKIVKLQGDILNVKHQLEKAIQQNERQINTNSTLIHENSIQKATIQQQQTQIQNTDINLQVVLADLARSNNIHQELNYEIYANKQSIQNLKQIILQYQQKELIRVNYGSSIIVSKVYHLFIEPTYHQIPHSEEQQYIQTNNIGEPHLDETFSQSSSNIEQKHNYKVNIIQSKSFQGQNQNEQMSFNLAKREEYCNPHENEQLHKSMCMKDKAIKKYQIYFNRYKHQMKKYQKQILELQGKTRKLELQILHLNQIIGEQIIHKEMLSVEELPDEIQHHLNISEDAMEHTHIQKLTQKEVELRVKEESINFKIQGIINAVMQLNAFKTEIKQSSQTSLVDAELYELGLDSFNPQSHS